MPRMSSDRLQQVVDVAAQFRANNDANPVTTYQVMMVAGVRDRRLAEEVAELVNSRPADPFAGLGGWSE